MGDEVIVSNYRGREARTTTVLETVAGVVSILVAIGFSIGTGLELFPLYGGIMFALFIVFSIYGVLNRMYPVPSFFFTMIMLISQIIYLTGFNALDTMFEYLKLFSVYLGVVFVLLFRIDNMLRHQEVDKSGYYAPEASGIWNKIVLKFGSAIRNEHFDNYGWCWFLWFALVLNIMQAVVADIGLGNYANAIAGFYLVLSMPRASLGPWDRKIFFFTFMQKTWRHVLFVDNDTNGYYDMVYETNWFWVLMYTLWNANFSQDERAEHFGVVVVVLCSALLSDLPRSIKIDPALYMQARSFTLMCRYLILAWYDIYEEFADSTPLYNPDAIYLFGFFNILFVLLYVIYKFFTFDGKYSRSSIDRADVENVE